MAATSGSEEDASGTAADTSSGPPTDQEAGATSLPDAGPEAGATLLPDASSAADADPEADATLLPGESSPQFAFASPQFAAPEPAGPPDAVSPGQEGQPDLAASPYPSLLDSAQAQPGQTSVLDRHRTLVVTAAIAALVLVAVIVIVVMTLVSNASSTASIRVITPAPAMAGGLARDYTDEARPQFQAALAQFRQRFAAALLSHVSSYTAAIYTNAPAGSPTSPSVAVLYMGFNAAASPGDPGSAVSAAVSGIKKASGSTNFTSTLTVTGLPGDAKGECIGTSAFGNPVSACVWATDDTASFLVSLVPATTADLANLLKKMRPDLERG